jgi:magnesium transporter
MILAPLGSVSLIFNIIFSAWFLGTKITKFDVVGTILIIIGYFATKHRCTVVSSFGVPDSGNKSIEEIIKLSSRPAFIVYMSIQEVVVIFLVFMTKFLLWTLKSMSHAVISRMNSIRVSVLQDTARRDSFRSPSVARIESLRRSSQNSQDPISANPLSVDTTRGTLLRISSTGAIVQSPEDETAPLLVVNSTPRGKITEFVGMLYASVGGIVAAQTLLLTKGGVEVILSSFETFDLLHSITALVLAVLIALTAVLQVKRVNDSSTRSTRL